MCSVYAVIASLCLCLPCAAQQGQTGDAAGKAPAGSAPTHNAGQDDGTKANASSVPPRSDSADESLDNVGESSSSKDSKIDLSAPADDDKRHPESADAVAEAEAAAHAGEVGEFRPWDPHKAAKDVEVGDYYFKRRNYRGAESRYREALYYKDNDAMAMLRLAECLEKLGQVDEAAEHYKGYLKIMPQGPESEEARQGLQRVRPSQPTAASAAK